LFNTCYIFDKGKEIGHYRKINLFYRELGRITPGIENKVIEVQGIRVGLMICADALSDTAWEGTAKLKPQIIFIPTFSPYKEETVQSKFIRDEEIYVSGAKFCDCPVIKTCCIGTFKDTRLQGRSLAATPDGIIWRVQPEDEDKPAIRILDINLPS
jgi:predicted amidohydrolase